MTDRISSFYEALADHYHLIFEDWGIAIEQQAKILSPLLTSETSGSSLKILDCACGIGTQAIGFAALGHQVVASDISRAEIDRAQQEARRSSLNSLSMSLI
jgi:glycine/sarcosine N-methyltransferase